MSIDINPTGFDTKGWIMALFITAAAGLTLGVLGGVLLDRARKGWCSTCGENLACPDCTTLPRLKAQLACQDGTALRVLMAQEVGSGVPRSPRPAHPHHRYSSPEPVKENTTKEVA